MKQIEKDSEGQRVTGGRNNRRKRGRVDNQTVRQKNGRKRGRVDNRMVRQKEQEEKRQSR